jgi:hypothetical protein
LTLVRPPLPWSPSRRKMSQLSFLADSLASNLDLLSMGLAHSYSARELRHPRRQFDASRLLCSSGINVSTTILLPTATPHKSQKTHRPICARRHISSGERRGLTHCRESRSDVGLTFDVRCRRPLKCTWGLAFQRLLHPIRAGFVSVPEAASSPRGSRPCRGPQWMEGFCVS